MQHTLTTNSTLYTINRHRERFNVALQKRKALAYCIAILLVIAVGVVAWIAN